MPKNDKDINTSKEIQTNQDNKDHKWTVWSQGPKDAKETTRKFKQTTPGQVRDYKHFVNKRRFQRFEQVESVQPKNEDAPANSVAGGGVDMAPNAKGTKVFMKKFRVDGRTKEYREANRRIKERQEKIAQRQVQSKLDMFGVHANPFVEETESKKYLDTKEGSIEDAIIRALTNLDNPNDERETLTLPKKDVEVEEAKKSGYLEPDMKKRQDNNEKARKDMKKMGTPMKNPHLEEVEEARGAPSPKNIQGPARRYSSPLDSPNAIAAREKLRKVMRGIKKKDPDHPAVQNVKEEEVEIDELSKKTLGSYVKKASQERGSAGVELGRTAGSGKQTHDDVKKHAGKMVKRQKGLDRAVDKLTREESELDELSNKTMDSYAQKASTSQSDAEKKQDYKTADKRIAGKMRASRRKFSNDTNRILRGLKKESKETEDGERDAGSDKYTNYTKEMTPGQGITSDDAKKADVRKKKEQAAQQQQLNVDEDMKYFNTRPGSIEEAILQALMPERFQKKHEKPEVHDEKPEKHDKKLDKVDPDELKGKHKDRDDKDLDNDGDSDESDRYLHKRRKAIAKKKDQEDQKESIAPKQLSSPAPAGKNVKKTAAYKSGVRRSKASGEIHHKDDTHHTGTQRHMDDNLPQEKGSGHSTYHKDTRGKKKVPGSKQAHESVELTPMEQFEQLVAEKHKATEAFANPPSGMKFPTKGVKNMGGPKSRQLKDPKKEKMVGTKSGTKVVNRDDPKYKNAPEHESVQSPWISAAVAHLDKVAEKTIMDESDKDGYYAMVDAKNKAKKAGKDWRTMGQGARDAASGAEMIRRGYKKQSNGWVKK